MSKSNLRSFRYSDKVAEILEGFQGGSLNEKFENLVLYCFERLETRKKDLAKIEKDIEAKRKEYSKLCDQLRDVSALIQLLKSLQRFGLSVVNQSDDISKKKT